MILGKNKPVYIYEAGTPIAPESSAVRRLTRQELVTFMRDNRLLFSPKDIKNGNVHLSPNALELLRQSGLKSVLETPHVMSAAELQAYSKQRAAASSATKAQARGSHVATVRQKSPPAAAKVKTSRPSHRVPNLTKFLANKQVRIPKLPAGKVRMAESSMAQHVPSPLANFLATKRQEEADIAPKLSQKATHEGFGQIEVALSDRIEPYRGPLIPREVGRSVGLILVAGLASLVLSSAAKEVNSEHTGSTGSQVASFVLGTVANMHETVSTQTNKLDR